MYAFSKRKRLLKVKFIFKHKSFFLDYKAHVLDTWIQIQMLSEH